MSSDSKGLLLRGSMLRMMLLFANIAVALYMMPFLVHAVGDRWYGMWALIGTFMGYYGYLDFGLSVATQRFLAGAIGRNDRDEISKLFSTTLVVLGLFALVAILITAGIGVMAPRFFSDPTEIGVFRVVLAILSINIAITFLTAPINGMLTGNLRFDVATYIEFGKLVVRTVLIIYFINAGYSIVALAAITLISDAGGNIVKMIMARRLFGPVSISRAHVSRAHVSSLFDYGGKTFVNQLAELLRFQVDNLVIAAFINLSAVTLYNIAGQLVNYFRMLIGALLGVLIPLYARFQAVNDKESVYRTFYFVSKLAAAVAMLVGGAVIIFGRDFIELWMGPEYSAAYTVVVLLTVPTILFATQQPSISLIYGLGEVGALAKVSIFEALANVMLSLILVGPYGLAGVAIGTAVPLGFFSLYLLWFSARLVGGSVGHYLRTVGPILIVGLLLQLVAWYLIKQADLKSYLDLILAVMVVLPAQALVLLLVGFNAKELRLIKETGLRALGFQSAGGAQ